MNAAVSGAGSDGDYCERLGGQAINPFVGGDGLLGDGVGAERGPVTFLLDVFVRDRSFNDEHERFEPAFLGVVEKLHEVIADFISQHRIVQMDFWQTRNGAEQNIFDAWLSRRGD